MCRKRKNQGRKDKNRGGKDEVRAEEHITNGRRKDA